MEGDVIRVFRIYKIFISIHSLRMEGDSVADGRALHTLDISIHSLRMEGDTGYFVKSSEKHYFNPLPPHGGRPQAYQIHPPFSEFQSTPSAWRETVLLHSLCNIKNISIHSLRMEGDLRFNVSPSGIVISIHSLRMEGDRICEERG